MCGIAGQVTSAGKPPDKQAVERALLSLQHRGPDGSGLETLSHACLGHRRLSVIDLEHSQQPWLSPDRRFCMVFNGEIYNYLELREELRDLGYRFRSDGDTEVLMNMFIHYGPACLDRLNGMFALAIWDETEQSLFMARDRVGKKPLYYSENTGGVSFASEPGALLHFSDIDFDTDLDAAQDFFAYQFIPGSKTIYRGISKLPPAHYLSHRDGRTEIRCYWSPPRPMPARKNLPELCEELVDILDDAVRLRLRSDVPVGVFLSGGLDSSIILDSMSRLGADINSFTVGFSEKTFDERADARMIAARYSTRHHEALLDIHPEQLLDQCVAHTGEPFADPSALPTWLLCGQTRQQVTVALSGDGADELFAGYQRYRALPIVGLYQRLPAAVRGIIHHLIAERLPDSTSYYGNSLIKKLKLLLRMSDRLEQAPGDLLPQTFSCDERHRLFNPGVAEVRAADHVDAFDLKGLDPLSQMLLADLLSYLSEDILVKTDRMSMAHSLEARAPFLDYRLVEFACRLPPELKLKGGKTKYILHEAYKRRLPAQTLRKRKHGFAVPVGQWLCGSLRPVFEHRVLDTTCPDYLNHSEIRKLWNEHQTGKRDHGFKLWSLLVFFTWYSTRPTV